jgi:hypothetical protein
VPSRVIPLSSSRFLSTAMGHEGDGPGANSHLPCFSGILDELFKRFFASRSG